MQKTDEIMSIEVARKVFKATDIDLVKRDQFYRRSLRYYRNHNDIVLKGDGDSEADREKNNPEDPLHKHDSRVSSNFHQLLIDEKAAYAGSQPPIIDVGNESLNKLISGVLGDHWKQTIQKLMVDASLAGVAWLHLWRDDDRKLRYAVVPPNEVVPLYKSSLDSELQAVRRTYEQLDPTDGQVYVYNEYWTRDEATFFKRKQGQGYAQMIYDQRVRVTDSINDEQMDNVAHIKHGFNGVPYIPFYNNSDHTGDLGKYKGLIDAYDLIYNGFVNDVQDVQQVILILTNYSGTNKKQFLDNLRKWKLAEFENDGAGDKSGLDKLTVDIPVEARKALLDYTFKNIFYQGQGVNPDDLKAGTAVSGVAMKMLYGRLELKAGKMISEFEPSVNALIRFILDYLHANNKTAIKQTWVRTGIQNDLEQADIISKVADHTSKEAVAKHNPLVDDYQEELQAQVQEERDASERQAQHPDPFTQPNPLLRPGDGEGDE